MFDSCLHNDYIGISPRGARFYALPVDARKALPESGVARVFRAVLRTVMRADRSALHHALSRILCFGMKSLKSGKSRAFSTSNN